LQPLVFILVIFSHDKWMGPHRWLNLFYLRVQVHILNDLLKVCLKDVTKCKYKLHVIITSQNLLDGLLTCHGTFSLAVLSHHLHENRLEDIDEAVLSL
jgi:hypothetical protein